jgi:OOP family OmpA-OmpF porin
MHIRGRARLLLTLATLLVVAVPGRGFAQSSAGGPLDLQLFRPAIDSKGLITLNGSQVLGHLDFSFGLVLNYARKPLSIDGLPRSGVPCAAGVNCSRFEMVNMATGNLQAAIGFFKHIELGIGLPLTFWNGDTDPDVTEGQNADTGDIDAQGAGDLAIHLKGRILNTSKHPIGLALLASVTVPTGGDDKFLGEGRVTLTPQVIIDKEFFRGRLHLVTNVGARFRFGSKDSFTDDARQCTRAAANVSCGTGITLRTTHHLLYGVGLAFGIVAQRFDVVAEVVGQLGLNSDGYTEPGGESKRHFYHEALLGFRLYLARKSYLLFGAGRGLRGGTPTAQYGSPDIRAFLGFVFEPNIGDMDGDGIKDDVDKCPTQPEDMDDFEDEDGCPDEDNDKDGILEGQGRQVPERSPRTKTASKTSDGCPEADVLDRDKDGIPDSKTTSVPMKPEDKDGFEDGDGCPDPGQRQRRHPGRRRSSVR